MNWLSVRYGSGAISKYYNSPSWLGPGLSPKPFTNTGQQAPVLLCFALPIWRLAYEGNRQSWSGIVFWVKWCSSIKWSTSFIQRITYILIHLREFLCGSSILKVVNIPKPRHLIRGTVVTFPKNLREASGRCVIIDTEHNRREILSLWPIFCFQLCQLKALSHLTTCRRTSTRALQIEVTSAMCII